MRQQREQDEWGGEAHGVRRLGGPGAERHVESWVRPLRSTCTVMLSPGVLGARSRSTRRVGSLIVLAVDRRDDVARSGARPCRPGRRARPTGPRAPSGCVGVGRASRRRGTRASTVCPRSSCGTTWRTVFDGTAKPMPTLPSDRRPPVAICELTPITRPVVVEQRAARVARVDRGVGLDHLVDLEAVGRLDVAAEAGHDALGRRAVEAERVADRDGGVAHLHARASRRAGAA